MHQIIVIFFALYSTRLIDQIIADEGDNKMEEFCIAYNGLQCSKCAKSILKEGVCVKPDKYIKKCLSYNEADKCSQCAYGYYSNEDQNECLAITLEGCLIQEGDNCLGCKNNLKIIDDKCSSETSAMKNCLISGHIGDMEFCSLCEDGFLLDKKGICEEDKLNKGCFRRNEFDVCVECRYNYFIKEEKCFETKEQEANIWGFVNLLNGLFMFWTILLN